jgi:hypothetical protein
MRVVSMVPRSCNHVLLLGSFATILFLAGCVSVTCPGCPGGACPPDGGPPVKCVAVPYDQNPVTGCTSGFTCSAATTGKPCGALGAGTKCTTVNNGSGTCSCMCQ